eukprot:365359-Chlamydomonas_euryale.AAC.3
MVCTLFRPLSRCRSASSRPRIHSTTRRAPGAWPTERCGPRARPSVTPTPLTLPMSAPAAPRAAPKTGGSWWEAACVSPHAAALSCCCWPGCCEWPSPRGSPCTPLRVCSGARSCVCAVTWPCACSAAWPCATAARMAPAAARSAYGAAIAWPA